ncbi:MAG TPA: geranylgeranyl reductase family protein [Acidimicrobiales bacterium]|nr:geranylgeranyl reductase family protein [Acidimicrobiales bacterium]
MCPWRFDVVVIGGGPAGSVAAFVLAKGGARVALVDKSTFPRDKACGDLVGPRGLQVMADLGIPEPEGPEVGDMLVVGPTGRPVLLPSAEGLTYPGHGRVVTRNSFDAMLHEAAVDAGAIPVVGRADEPLDRDGRVDGYRLSSGEELRADFVIGADGATSRVATAAGLVEGSRVLWGFAVRTYLPHSVRLPAIVLWEPTPWNAFPGYGWVFPGPAGEVNVGLGLGTLSDRQAGAKAVRALPSFLQHLRSLGLLPDSPSRAPSRHLGGWLKMGMVGTTPASGQVLLVGDAAGLVNPLQGEGIAQALGSGRAAGEAVLKDPTHAAGRYCASLGRQRTFQRIAAATQAALVGRPRAVAAVARLLATAGHADALAGGWAIFWNELLDGAPKGRHRSVAAAVTRISGSMTARTATARWFDAELPADLSAAPPGRQVALPAIRPRWQTSP